MEIILSSLIGAISAIAVAYVGSKRSKAKKEELISSLIKELNINQNNIYILDSSHEKSEIKYESNAAQEQTLIIIK